ncbi:MAG TPA: NTP transferase domain-containing protein [Candidatus Binataceae bacterium]
MVSRFEGAIIAAGRGERLRVSGGASHPKPLVELCGEPLLTRQAVAMLAAGASRVHAVINSETAQIARMKKITMPERLELIVRDTPNSMQSLFALGEVIGTGRFLLATVDSVIPLPEFTRFTHESEAMTDPAVKNSLDGVLGLVRWRGDKRPLYASVTFDGLISGLGDEQTELVTAGIYFLTTKVFTFADEANGRNLDALRRFLAMLIEKGLRLGAITLNEAIDIDEAADLESAREAIRRS